MPQNGITPQNPDLDDDFDDEEDPEELDETDDGFLDDLDVVLADE